MPKDFERCVNSGGKVITKTLKGGKYVRLCVDKKGKWHTGEIKKRKDK